MIVGNYSLCSESYYKGLAYTLMIVMFLILHIGGKNLVIQPPNELRAGWIDG